MLRTGLNRIERLADEEVAESIADIEHAANTLDGKDCKRAAQFLRQRLEKADTHDPSDVDAFLEQLAQDGNHRDQRAPQLSNDSNSKPAIEGPRRRGRPPKRKQPQSDAD